MARESNYRSDLICRFVRFSVWDEREAVSGCAKILPIGRTSTERDRITCKICRKQVQLSRVG